jgi:hypothetical protein
MFEKKITEAPLPICVTLYCKVFRPGVDTLNKMTRVDIR